MTPPDRVPGVEIQLGKGDICYVSVQKACEHRPKSILVRFQSEYTRDAIWQTRASAKKNGLIIEEWLTGKLITQTLLLLKRL